MLDIKFIRDNPELVRQAIVNKKSAVNLDQLLQIDSERRKLQVSIEALNQEKNEAASKKDIERGRLIRENLSKIEDEFKDIDRQFIELLSRVPNIPSDDTPIGDSEDQNLVIKTVGEIPEFGFKPKEHWELGTALGVIDTEKASEISGPRFAYLKGGLALMEFALTQYIFSLLTNELKLKEIISKAGLEVTSKPFQAVLPPVFIKPEVYQRMGRLEPKEERYYIPSDDLYLIGSAEHTLGPLHMDEIISESQLPIRYIGFSTAFRREAGSYGKDTKGILRLHQFDKVEMESFSAPEDSRLEQDLFIAIQEYITNSLGIPYQLVLKCTADMGDPDHRAVDLESWMPGQNKYRETHTSDLMTDYQSRRLNTKLRRSAGKTEFVHMNDATAAAGRTLIAIMENYQQEDGSILIPEVLKPFMSGVEIIK
jgi:seryl-tRNA synthetase